MSASIAIKTKIVLFMVKFESATVVKRKLQSDFGQNTPTEHGIRIIFERFCETEPSKIVHGWKTDSH